MPKPKKRDSLANMELDGITPEERLFCCLLCCGYPANVAYKIAFPSSKANPTSASAQASRYVNSWKIQGVLKAFQWAIEQRLICVPEHLVRERKIKQ